jgi:hypothetical protein
MSLGWELGGEETKAKPLELSPPHGFEGAVVEFALDAEWCFTNDGDGGVDGERRSLRIETAMSEANRKKGLSDG